ncbi:Peptidase C19 [Trypanosoma melophagium]|uniref:Peptidase C19 n=1 Tax=Trypanosoma melophagium TaxID=715481 RepID=UPI00351A85BE|nr:Peptidase C19 [Trypanosoma melophagium]
MLHNTCQFSHKEIETPPPYGGLVNQGCTCYLNAVIQILYHLPSFRQTIYSVQNPEKYPITLALRNIFCQLNCAYSSVFTRDLTEAFGWGNKEEWIQHDVHEMMLKLFHSLESTCKGTPQENFIRDLFCGEFTYVTRTVDGVDHTTYRKEGFYDVELLVKDKNSIYESLNQWIEPERIEGVSIEIKEGEPCSLHTVERKQFFSRLPPVLFVHPNRADFCTETFRVMMLHNSWTFCNSLDLEPYTISEGDNVEDSKSMETKYELRSVVIHQGTVHSGHYLAYIHIGEDWICFDDNCVSKVTEEVVMQAAYGGKNDIPRGSLGERASLLVYVNKGKSQDILREKHIPKHLEIVAENVNELNKRKWDEQSNERVCYYLTSEESLINVLDGCTGEDLKIASFSFLCTSSLQEFYDSIAVNINQSVDRIRIWVYNENPPTTRGCDLLKDVTKITSFLFIESLPVSKETEIWKSSNDCFFAPVRFVSEDTLFFYGIVHSREELKKLIIKNEERLKCFMCTSGPTVYEVSIDEALIGSNIILCPESVSNERLLDILQHLKYNKVNLFLLENKNAASCTHFGSFQLDDNTSYEDLQKDAFRLLSLANLKLPPSPEYIGFHCQTSADSTGPSLFIAAPEMENGYKTTLGLLVRFRNAKRILYVRILPAPLSLIDVSRVVIFNVGGGFRPSVFVEKRSYTLGELYRIALEQYGSYLSPGLVKRIKYGLQENVPALRLLSYDERRKPKVHVNNNEEVLVNPGYFLIDVLAEVKKGFSLVDVYFCSRRGGVEYFGFQTNIAISNTYEETGEEIARRVAHKIKATGKVGDITLWIVAVQEKGGGCHTIGSKDSVKSVLRGNSSEVDCLIIDRPRSLLLDAVEDSYRRYEQSIAIKETTGSELSRRNAQEE